MSVTSGSRSISANPGLATVNIREAAEMLGVHANTVRRRVKSGELRAEKLRTERGEEYRISVDDLKRVPRVVTEIVPKRGGNGNGNGSEAGRSIVNEPEGQSLDVTAVYGDLKDALREAATLRTERDIVQRQYADARVELEDLRKRVDDAESRAMKLETERIELLAELEQTRIAYRHSRDWKKRKGR